MALARIAIILDVVDESVTTKSLILFFVRKKFSIGHKLMRKSKGTQVRAKSDTVDSITMEQYLTTMLCKK